MTSSDPPVKVPQDLVAIFHASFHPTVGNTIDWSLKIDDEINLDNLEFNALPSGLHLVGQDVVYFTKDNRHGVCVYHRRTTTEEGHRGARLSSLGILLAKSPRPKPWRHLTALKDLIDTIESFSESSMGTSGSDDPWERARQFFEERKVRNQQPLPEQWQGWSYELDSDLQDEPAPQNIPQTNPTLHLPHLLRILGPSSLTLYKHVIGRKRILIYTQPPVEAACILCHAAADMCYEDQVDTTSHHLKGKCREGINVLGMVTLMDVERMKAEGETGRGWIACTTDAIFLERPAQYDLLIDLTTTCLTKASRPAFYASRPIIPRPSSGATHRLSTTRFAWSDIRLWSELDRILRLDGIGCCSSPDDGFKTRIITAWTDVWRVYEDACIVCASLWMGWKGPSSHIYPTEGAIRLDGADDISLDGSDHVRSLGMGIEGRALTSKGMKRTSGMSWRISANNRRPSMGETVVETAEPEGCYRDHSNTGDKQLLTTLALLQTFHANTLFQLSILESYVRNPSPLNADIIYLTAKDVVMFDLWPLSRTDTRYLEWLAAEYGGGTTVVVKRAWKDIFGVIAGCG